MLFNVVVWSSAMLGFFLLLLMCRAFANSGERGPVAFPAECTDMFTIVVVCRSKPANDNGRSHFKWHPREGV